MILATGSLGVARADKFLDSQNMFYVQFISSAIFTSSFYPSNLPLMWPIGHFHRFLRIRKLRFPKIRKSQLRHHCCLRSDAPIRGQIGKKHFCLISSSSFFAKLSGQFSSIVASTFDTDLNFQMDERLSRNDKMGIFVELDEGGWVLLHQAPQRF